MSDKTNNQEKPLVSYFFRNHKCGYSIYKAISPIVCANSDKVFVAPKYKANLFDVIINLLYVFLHRDRKVINHVTGDIHYVVFALIGCKTVLTIHDLVSILNAHNKVKRKLLEYLWFRLPIKLASGVTCISNSTKKQIANVLNINDDRIKVIYDPIDPIFKYTPKDFNADFPTILHIGTGWNKNLRSVIEAVKDISCKLLIIGNLSEEQKSLLINYRLNYEAYSNLTDIQIYQKYCECDVVSFPSIYEGFGMPIIEGMAVGRVVVTSNLEPMTEVARNAACLINPNDVKSIRDGFLKVINDKEYRSELISAGIQNVKRFDKDKIRAEYDALYSRL